MHFEEYQERAKSSDNIAQGGMPTWSFPAMGLQGQVGALSDTFRKALRDGPDYTDFKPQVHSLLGKCLWYISTIATRMRLSLEDIAADNLDYNGQRWGATGPQSEFLFPTEPRFDHQYPVEQRLPRRICMRFECSEEERETKRLKRVQCYFRNEPAGDKIDDNAWVEDGYRFHDIMHLSYAAHLGWSPVLRHILPPKFKRRDENDMDRIEDGARARDTEEAITRFIHAWGSKHNYFRNSRSLDTGLLEAVKSLTIGLEVQQCTFSEWQTAIIQGYRSWHQVSDNDGGWVTADLRGRSLTYSKHDPDGA